MIARVNTERHLELKRSGGWHLQWCPFASRVNCGQWCPLFEEGKSGVSLHCGNGIFHPFETKEDA